MEDWLDLLEPVLKIEDFERARDSYAHGFNPADFLLAENLVSQDTLLSTLSFKIFSSPERSP